MDYLPIFIDVRAQACLVVGGGTVATRKIELLQQAGARVHVVAPQVCDALSALVATDSVQFDQRAYEARDLNGKRIVIAATNRAEINAHVAADARARAIPVNVVDSPALCTFIMPSIVDRSPVLVAVSTAGASPVLARLTRARIEVALPQRLGKLAEFAARHRAAIKSRLVESVERREFWQRVLEGHVGELVLAGHESEATAALERQLAGNREPPEPMRATLIATGLGDIERLPLRAARLLGSADVLIHETAALHVLHALGRRDAERVDIGEVGTGSGRSWSELADAVAARAARGERVCVVRVGDPYADPQAQDVLALRALGVRVEILRPAP